MRAEEALVLDGVEPAVAPGVAAKDAPPGQDDPTQYAELGYGLDRIVRAARLVLAPRRDQRREERAVQRDREDRHTPAEGHRSSSSASDARTPPRPSRSASSRDSGRATIT